MFLYLKIGARERETYVFSYIRENIAYVAEEGSYITFESGSAIIIHFLLHLLNDKFYFG